MESTTSLRCGLTHSLSSVSVGSASKEPPFQREAQSGLALAEWFSKRPEVERVLHPAMPDDPGYAIWKRDFLGASGLFSVVLKPVERRAFAAFVDGLELYGIGASWGGYESLIMPFNPSPIRKVSRWPYAGPAFRIHAGLEHIDDLIADLEAGFARLNKA